MNQLWIERIKTVALALLVVISFVLTGYLFYSLPAYQDDRTHNYVPPYIIAGKNKDIVELTAPHQFITHRLGRHALILPNTRLLTPVLNPLSEGIVTNIRRMDATPAFWDRLFNQTAGLELLFNKDISIHYLDLFFKQELIEVPLLKDLQDISRIWLYYDLRNKHTQIVFISDKKQIILHASLEKVQLNNLMPQLKSTVYMDPIADGPMPWTKHAARPFKRIFYIPSQPLKIKKITSKAELIEIETMKKWLFPEPNIEPIELKNEEKLYLYNNQMLNYSNKNHAMIYHDTSFIEEKRTSVVTREFDQLHSFMQRHKGWTGSYHLDEIVNIEDANQYSFRLFLGGYPVYWYSRSNIHPDQLQLTVKNGGVSRYERSMRYLSLKPLTEKEYQLTNPIQILKQKNISLAKVIKIYPGYQASFLEGKEAKEVLLMPHWIIETAEGLVK